MSSIYWLARGSSALASQTPRIAAHALGTTVGASSYLAWRSKRRVTQQNMAQVTGRPVDDPYVRHLALSSWYNYGRYAADFMRFPYLDIDSVARHTHDLSRPGASWQEHVEQSLRPGRGMIIATAHFGNWDIAGALAARYTPLYAVAESFSDPRLNEMLQNQRIAKGISILPMEGSARRILRVLQQNKTVAILSDRPVSSDQGVPISFFGRTTYVPAGPAALAVRSGATVLPGYAWYGHANLWYTRAFPPIFPSEYTTGTRDEQVIAITQRIYSTLEEMVRSWTTQWYMFRAFWPAENPSSKQR